MAFLEQDKEIVEAVLQSVKGVVQESLAQARAEVTSPLNQSSSTGPSESPPSSREAHSNNKVCLSLWPLLHGLLGVVSSAGGSGHQGVKL